MATERADPVTLPAESPAVYSIMGREVRLPVEVRDASAAMAYYLVSANAAQRLIAPSGLRVARVLPGRALCTIGSMDYKDSDLGRYREVAVTFFVDEPGARSFGWPGRLLALLRGKLAVYIHQLPVDGDFTCEAGRAIWGFPKFVTEIELASDGDRKTCVLRADGEDVLTQRVRAGGKRSFPARPQLSYAYREGVLYRTPSTMSGRGVGVRLGGEPLQLGSHSLAGELRRLGLPKRPLLTMSIEHVTASFSAAQRSAAG